MAVFAHDLHTKPTQRKKAALLGVSPQSFNNKMRRDNFSEKDLLSIAKALDCTLNISFTLNDTGESV